MAIPIQSFGRRWWSRQWLSRIGEQDAERMMRGEVYARQGNVKDFRIEDNCVKAEVRGSRINPYEVSVLFAPYPRAQQLLIQQLIQNHKEVVKTDIPLEWQQRFEEAGTHFFPHPETHMSMDCTCPDWTVPCKHMAAVCCLLAEFMDADPLLMFKLQGVEVDEPMHQPISSLPEVPLRQQPHEYWGIQRVYETEIIDEAKASPLASLDAMPGRISRKRLHEALAPVYQKAAVHAQTLLQHMRHHFDEENLPPEAIEAGAVEAETTAVESSTEDQTPQVR